MTPATLPPTVKRIPRDRRVASCSTFSLHAKFEKNEKRNKKKKQNTFRVKLYARLFYDPLMSLKGVLNLFSFFRLCRARRHSRQNKKKEIKIKKQQLKDMKGPLKVPGPGLHRFVCD